MSDSAFICPQCDLEIDFAQRPSPTIDDTGAMTKPHVHAAHCERCVAWIRLEGWSCWTATHYTMTPLRGADDALKSYPQGVWLVAAVTKLGD